MNEIKESTKKSALEIKEIEVTPEMIEAGLYEHREHHYDTDITYMLESIFRAMFYAKPDASISKPSR